jgi:hypothetical protein
LLLFSAGLAARGQIPLSNILPLVLDRSLSSTTALLRALDVARPIASAMLYELSEALHLRGISLHTPLADMMAQFDAAQAESISQALHHWQRSLFYQTALDDVASHNG